MYEALRTTASIIFAVVGAWLAIIYPERLKLSFGKSASKSPAQKNMNLLLTPAVHSTFILVILLLIGVLAPLLKVLPVLRANIELFRGVSYVCVVLLTLWQVAIVVMAIFPAEMVQSLASKEAAEKAIDDHYDTWPGHGN